MRFILVQTNLRSTLHIGIEQPFDDKESAFDAPDFAQRQGKFILSRIGRELIQQLTVRHSARCHCGYGAQNIRPVLKDQYFPDFATDQATQFLGSRGGVNEIETLGW